MKTIYVLLYLCSQILLFPALAVLHALLYRLWVFLPYFSPKLKAYFSGSHPDVFLVKGVLKICSKFTGEHPCRSGISIKLQSNFIEITIGHGCSAVNLLYIFRTPFTKSTSEGLLLRLPWWGSLTIWIDILFHSCIIASS